MRPIATAVGRFFVGSEEEATGEMGVAGDLQEEKKELA